MPTVTVSLAHELAEFVERRVVSNEYGSAEDVLLYALERMRRDYEAKLETLRAAIDVGMMQADRGEYAEIDVGEITREVLGHTRKRA